MYRTLIASFIVYAFPALTPTALAIMAVDGSPQAKRQVIHIIYDSFEPKPKIFDVPSDIRGEVVAMLLRIARQHRAADITIGSTMVSPDGAASALIRLGEEDFIREYTEHYRTIKGQTLDGVLRSGRHPLIIPYLAGGLFESDNFKSALVGGDVRFSALPVACARIILSNLELDVFPPLVRDRATELLKTFGRKDLVYVMRRWWNANQGYIKAKQYDRVAPPDRLDVSPAPE
jgi:hypothetical protein